MLGKATIQSWPFEVKFTFWIWLAPLFYSVGLGTWLATVGFPKVPEFVIVPFVTFWGLSWLLYLQLACYRAYGFGFLEMWVNLLLDPEFRRKAPRGLMWSVWDRKPPP
jgi:hypothetical protein